MKPLDPNDPRFTAKALGENETQDINPDANQEFEALLDFAQTLKSELQTHDTKNALTEKQKERVRKAIEPQEKKLLTFPMWINAIAACLVLGVVGVVSFNILNDNPRTLLSEGVDPFRAEALTTPPSTVTRKDSDLSEMDSQLTEMEPSESEVPKVISFGDSPKEAQVIPSPTGISRNEPRRLDTLRQRDEEDEIFELSPDSRDLGENMSTVTEKVMEDVDGIPDIFSKGRVSKPAGTQANLTIQEQPRTAISSEKKIIEDPYSARPPKAPPTAFKTIEKQESWNREAYDRIVETAFKSPRDHALSTFSIDVDTASYANMRRYLNEGTLPPHDAVRIEELVNYFTYNYEGPKDETPFAVHVDAASAPWNPNHRLVRIALQGDKVDLSERPQANLVFLIDVSGSMSDQNKLPLVQRAMNLLVDQMSAEDRIAVVVYAGASGLALPSTTANNKETIQHAINNLQSGGTTNGGAGIELAYSVAQKHFIDGGINRVILCTDGDFNVGTTDRGSLTLLIEEKAKTGVFFSAFGFGSGNYQDATMEELSNKGNGNYGYIDSFKEARKVFLDDMLGTLFTVAKDVKIQVEFNPAKVNQYRLIGYENRMLAKEDFNDDKKDAGEIGAGHTVTALYEIIPTGVNSKSTPSVDPLKYQTTAISEPADESAEMLTVKLRYIQPEEDVSQLLERPFIDSQRSFDNASDDFRFASSVAAFGMILRASEFTGEITLEDIRNQVEGSQGSDTRGLRSEFLELVNRAIQLMAKENQ